MVFVQDVLCVITFPLLSPLQQVWAKNNLLIRQGYQQAGDRTRVRAKL